MLLSCIFLLGDDIMSSFGKTVNTKVYREILACIVDMYQDQLLEKEVNNVDMKIELNDDGSYRINNKKFTIKDEEILISAILKHILKHSPKHVEIYSNYSMEEVEKQELINMFTYDKRRTIKVY